MICYYFYCEFSFIHKMNHFVPEQFYHIYNHSNGSDDLFRNDNNFNFFLLQWAKYILPIADAFAYCLMPNHFHFLIAIKDNEELKKAFSTLKIDWEGSENQSNLISKQFSNLFNSYAKAYNKMYDRRGSLFNRPFKSKVINSNHYLTKVIHYIHHNPVHHGFTDAIEAWPYSSYHALISEKNTQLKRDYIHSWFGDIAVFKDLHKAPLKKLEVLESLYT